MNQYKNTVCPVNFLHSIISSSSPEWCWTMSLTAFSCNTTARHVPEQKSPWSGTLQSQLKSQKWSDRPSHDGRAAAQQETSPFHHKSEVPQRTVLHWSWIWPSNWYCSLEVTGCCREEGGGWEGRGTPTDTACTLCHVTPGSSGLQSPVLPPAARWASGPDLTSAPLTSRKHCRTDTREQDILVMRVDVIAIQT